MAGGGGFTFLFLPFYMVERGDSRKEKKSPKNTAGHVTYQSSEFLVKGPALSCRVLSCAQLETH